MHSDEREHIQEGGHFVYFDVMSSYDTHKAVEMMIKVFLWLWIAPISNSYRCKLTPPTNLFRSRSVGADWEVEGSRSRDVVERVIAPPVTSSDDRRDIFDDYFSTCMAASDYDADREAILSRSNQLGRTLLAGMKRPHVRDEAWR